MEIEQNLYLHEKKLDLTSYQNEREVQINQIRERESVLRRERERLYENEHKQDLKNIYEEHRRLNDQFETKSSNKNLQEKEKQKKDERQQRLREIRSETKQKLQEISYETEQELQKISCETEQELQKIKHESEQKSNERKLKNEKKLEELNKETSRLQAEEKEKFDQKLRVINSDRNKIIQDANKDLQNLILRCKALDQETSEYLSSIIGNEDRTKFYNLILEKIREINLVSTDMKAHLKVLMELLQMEKVSFFLVPYDEIIPILKSIDFSNLQESLTKLEEIKGKILGE